MLLAIVLSAGAFGASTPQHLTALDASSGAINVPDTAGATVTVIGDGRTPVRMWFNSWWTHEFAFDRDGTVTLMEEHASSQKTIMRNVPAVYFANGAGVALPSLKPLDATAASAPASAPSSAGSVAAAPPSVIRAPALPKPSHPGEVVAVQLRNDTAAELPSRVVTFGQAFVKGDFPDGYILEANAGGSTIPVQADVKARYADKSVKHAVVSLQAPALSASASLSIMLSAKQGNPSTSPISPKAILASGYDLQFIREFPFAGSPPLSVDAKRVLAASALDGTLRTWLSGPLASEYRVTQRIVPNLQATFDIRATADGAIMTDLSVANDFAYLFPETSTYSATVTQTGMPAWKSPVVAHRKFQVWHKVFWNRDGQLPSVILDVDYLERAGAIPNYDLSSGLSRTALEQSRADLAKSDTGPLGSALIVKQMGTTGGRPDIGPTTTWAADYLVSQDPEARAIMLAQADAAASIPWHVREIDGGMVTATSHPLLWLDLRCETADCLPGGYVNAAAPPGWGLDAAHEPDLAYVPYLTTGSHFYLDQLQSEANWVVLAQDPAYRKKEKGLIYPANQVRGTAWNLRDIANAAWITPDTDPLKAYFETMLANNLDGLQQIYLAGRAMHSAGAIEGFIQDPYNATNVGPWQQDFVSMTMTLQGLRGSETARKFAGWMENFISGRFLHGANGYDPLHGPAYYLVFVDPETKSTVNNWSDLYRLNFAGKPAPTQLDGTPDAGYDYAAIARAATANLFSLTQDARSLRAFAFIAANAEPMLHAFPNGNSFNISPRFPDGHLLRNDEIQYASSLGGRIIAKTAHSLLIGGSAHVTLQGAAGTSILVGGGGAVTMIGAPGANYFFAGAGDAVLAGAAGRNYFGIGTGKAQIDLGVIDAAVDRIEGFRPGRDHIHLIGLDVPPGKIVEEARKDGDGSTVLTIGPGHTVEFVGMAPADITPAFFD